jgi:hypothetical protein
MTTFFEIFDRVMCVSNYALLSYMGLSLAVMSLQQPSGEMGGAMGMLLHQNSGFFIPIVVLITY